MPLPVSIVANSQCCGFAMDCWTAQGGYKDREDAPHQTLHVHRHWGSWLSGPRSGSYVPQPLLPSLLYLPCRILSLQINQLANHLFNNEDEKLEDAVVWKEMGEG